MNIKHLKPNQVCSLTDDNTSCSILKGQIIYVIYNQFQYLHEFFNSKLGLTLTSVLSHLNVLGLS